MLQKKTKKEIELLRQGGKKLSQIIHQVADQVKVGATGRELNQIAEELIAKAGGSPSFKNYNGYPFSLCISKNQTVVHGIPNKTPFKEGDIIGLDLGMKYKGLHTDMALTVPVAKIDKQTQQLLDITKQALQIGIAEIGPDKYIGDIGKAIEKFIKPYGYSIVRDLAGHGVGHEIHEDPIIPNYDCGQSLAKMFPGLVLAIEPMIILGKDYKIKTASNGWDVIAVDDSLTAHFEHTVAVTDDGYLILTE